LSIDAPALWVTGWKPVAFSVTAIAQIRHRTLDDQMCVLRQPRG
jgi:hypothetical protein